MANIDRWFLRIAVIYALVAMFLGITMGIREDFTQASTHAHLNLVGWVSMALYALVYRQYPAAAQSRFAMLHFWIANVGAVLLTVGIYTQMADMPSLAFIVISGSFITILGMLIFTVIVYSKVQALVAAWKLSLAARFPRIFRPRGGSASGGRCAQGRVAGRMTATPYLAANVRRSAHETSASRAG